MLKQAFKKVLNFFKSLFEFIAKSFNYDEFMANFNKFEMFFFLQILLKLEPINYLLLEYPLKC